MVLYTILYLMEPRGPRRPTSAMLMKRKRNRKNSKTKGENFLAGRTCDHHKLEVVEELIEFRSNVMRSRMHKYKIGVATLCAVNML